MKKKLSIITSSIAACAIFASLFAFNGYAVGSQKVEIPKVESTVTSVNSDQGIQQVDAAKGTPIASEVENKNQNTTSDTKTVNSNTVSANNNSNALNCPKTNAAQSTNNQQTKIKSANVIDNLRNAINNANCNKTTAKTRNYSALQSKLDALLANFGLSANKPTTNTSTTKPTTCKPSTSTPTTSKPTTSKPATSKPATSKPATSKPATSKPATSKPTTSTSTNGDYNAFQKKVVELVNVERSKNGLKPLTTNTQLSKTATLKSQDMAKLNYMNHNSPTYGSPFDMMKKYGISYRAAGENIAMGQTTPEQVMQDWMNSTTGHRENILNSSFTQIGVGVAKNSSGRIYWTQQFIG
ncbi:MAG: CAP domain-containing protein [Ruminiclostridium sp.]